MAVRGNWRAGLIGLCLGCSPASGPDVEALHAEFTVARVANLPSPLILVSVPQLGVAATLVPVGSNAEVTTWQSRDGVQLSFLEGVLVATRGLGNDLMTTEVEGLRAALAGAQGHYGRAATYLAGDGETLPVRWRCTLAEMGARPAVAGIPVHAIAETCTGPDGTLNNRYHRGADGTLLWSRQWVSAAVGYLEVTRIK